MYSIRNEVDRKVRVEKVQGKEYTMRRINAAGHNEAVQTFLEEGKLLTFRK